MEKLTVGSLFSGVGGFDLGLYWAGGFETIWMVEIDEFCQKVLKKHAPTYWPNAKIYGDIKDVSKENLISPDVIVGGFPCQDLSVGWNGEGLAGKRSGLWFEYLRIITELKPRWVIIENVPGLLSSNRGNDFAIILQGLAKGGYLSAWRVFDAQHFGIPQQRRRVFIVSSLGNGDCARVLFEGKQDRDNYEKPKNTRSAPVYAYKKRGGFGWSESQEIALTLESQSGKHTGGNDTIPLLFTNDLPRWATPLECERIAGFPDNYTDILTKTHRYRKLGNAVVPQIPEILGRMILEIENVASLPTNAL